MFLGFFGEFLFDFDGITRDVFATLAKEEPRENANRTAEDKEGDFGRQRPVGVEEDDGIGDAETQSVTNATS